MIGGLCKVDKTFTLFQDPIEADRPGLVRNDHPDTAKQAATQANTGRTRAWVQDFIEGNGEYGATDEEIIEAAFAVGYVSANSLRPRRVELVRDNVVMDSGERRKTRSGRKAIVWVVIK